MARISEHHVPKAGVAGKCSVPLFDACGPAGFCDRDAYGEQYKGRLSRFFGNNRAPYAPGLCCKIHGGAGEEDVRVMRDGNMWHAFDPDFENLQESVSAFGETQEIALANLLLARASDGENPA